MNITVEAIESLKSERGGWTAESLAKLGVGWPPKKGWKRRLLDGIGSDLDEPKRMLRPTVGSNSSHAKAATVYTDGACIPNPGMGGYAATILRGSERSELSGGFRLTTNNRMEIMAAIVGLEALEEPSDVRLYTDSKYLQESITLGWARNWRRNGWRKGPCKRLNWDLWQRLLTSLDKHDVDCIWVRGHAGDVENERCDVLSVEAVLRSPQDIDKEYEEAAALRQEQTEFSLS